ncbi:MAG: bacillithiol system redox-active protein YtxJ [Flavobacteriales bacterium]|nr:bacillithiol system redox-active protein YtxJ [Flavobacteriales bacterium]MCB9335127.1 bacillithiol system redox-active protein YtxJ [Flavobacteriales bacterium]
MNWLTLEDVTSLDEVISASFDSNLKAVAIFKHSTRCPISFAAKSRLELAWDFKDELPIYYLDLINFREISNEIAERFNIQHESPQILIVKNGECIHHASHISISAKEIAKLFNN